MWSSERRVFLLRAPLFAALAGCGFEPMYGSGTPARAGLGEIYVELIPSGAGYELRNALIDALGPAASPTHVLYVDLDLETEGVALTTQNITTRFDVRGTAAFRLVPIDGDAPILSDTVEAIAGYSAPESETSSAFASRVAEKDAIRRVSRQLAQRISTQLAIRAPEWATEPGAAAAAP
jgi:LPS-assembly lipoprotein